MEQAGMIGVGAMGTALLERLTAAGVQVTVYDTQPQAVDAARALGAKVGTSPKAVAQAAKVVDVVVRTDQEVLDCVLGKDGVLEGARKGTLVLLHSTILPETTRKVADAAGKHGVDILDACMLGQPPAVRDGKLSFMVGGPAELVERVKPHLLKMGSQAVHTGPLGTGNVAKLARNLVLGSERLVIHEAIRIAEAGGIPYRDMLEVMRQIHSGSLISRWQSVFDPSGASSTPKGTDVLYEKDLPLAAQLGRQYGLELPITERLVAAGLKLQGKG